MTKEELLSRIRNCDTNFEVETLLCMDKECTQALWDFYRVRPGCTTEEIWNLSEDEASILEDQYWDAYWNVVEWLSDERIRNERRREEYCLQLRLATRRSCGVSLKQIHREDYD